MSLCHISLEINNYQMLYYPLRMVSILRVRYLNTEVQKHTQRQKYIQAYTCTAFQLDTHQIRCKWNTWSIIITVNEAPRYIVPQNMPTPSRHMSVAINVAYGMRDIHDWQQSPVMKVRKEMKVCYKVTGAVSA